MNQEKSRIDTTETHFRVIDEHMNHHILAHQAMFSQRILRKHRGPYKKEGQNYVSLMQ